MCLELHLGILLPGNGSIFRYCGYEVICCWGSVEWKMTPVCAAINLRKARWLNLYCPLKLGSFKFEIYHVNVHRCHRHWVLVLIHETEHEWIHKWRTVIVSICPLGIEPAAVLHLWYKVQYLFDRGLLDVFYLSQEMGMSWSKAQMLVPVPLAQCSVPVRTS